MNVYRCVVMELLVYKIQTNPHKLGIYVILVMGGVKLVLDSMMMIVCHVRIIHFCIKVLALLIVLVLIIKNLVIGLVWGVMESV